MAKKKTATVPNYLWFGIIYTLFTGILTLVYTDLLIDGGMLSRQLALAGFNILVGVSILFIWFNKKNKFDFGFVFSLPYLLIIAFLLIQFISVFTAHVKSEAWQSISKYNLAVVYLTLTASLLRTGYLKTSHLFKGISILSALGIFIALFQLAKWDSHLDFRNNIYEIKSNFGNKNLFASILFFGLIANFALLREGIYKKLMWVSIVITLAMLVLIQTRIVLVALVVATLFYLFFEGKNLFQKSKLLKWGLSGIVLLLVLFALTNQSYFKNLTDSRSYRERLEVWNNSYKMLQEHPVTGVGAGNWQFEFMKYGIGGFENPSIRNALTTFQRPHNDFLWVAGESGYPGLIVYLAIFASVFFLFIRQKNYLLASAILGYVLIAFTDFPLERIEHQYILYSLMAVGIAGAGKLKRHTYIPVILTIIVSFATYPFGLSRMKSEIQMKKMYLHQQRSNWQGMLRTAKDATTISYEADAKSIPLTYYSGIAAYTLGDIANAKLDFEKALKISPYNIHALNNMGSCYNQLGDPATAMTYFEKALEISPAFEEAILNKCVVYYNSKDYYNAFLQINKISLKSENKNYPVFLKAILSSYLNKLLKEEKDPMKREKIISLLSSEKDIMTKYLAFRNGDSQTFEP